MKNAFKLFALALVMSLPTACSSDSDGITIVPEITITSSEFTIGSEQGSEAKATFSINVDWKTSTISYEGEAKNWLTITPLAGKLGDERSMTMTAKENPVETERKASFTIIYGGKEEKLTITQQGKNLDPTITITSSEFTIAYAQDSEAKATFSINVDWETSAISYEEGGDKDWLTITPANGKSGTDQSITMKVLENSTAVERKASFTINYGEDKKHELTVTQSSKLMADVTTHFDVTFATKLKQKGYITDAKKILISDVINIKTLDIAGTNIINGGLTSLTGIEYFESLTELLCSYNDITTLDVSKNLALTKLSCTSNKLTTLDVTKNLALTDLVCLSNKLTTLDVTKNINLSYLVCAANQLTELDVTNNPKISNLQVNHNTIKTLDVTSITALSRLTCNNNQIAALDMRSNPNLTFIECNANKIAILDVTKNPKLAHLQCSYNQLAELDVTNNPKLTKLYFGSNQITTIDVSGISVLDELQCSNNKLTELDVSKNTKLTALIIISNQLAELDVTNLPLLMSLHCTSNKLTELDISKNTRLSQVLCANNKITRLDVSQNTNLSKFNCSNNQIAALDVSKNTGLKEFICTNNKLTELDVSKIVKFTEMKCENNPGIGNSFIVKATFGNANIPSDKFTKGNWIYAEQTISIDYQKQ